MLQVEDDHSRFILASYVTWSETSEAAITVVSQAISRHGPPARFLTDNGTAFNQSRQGKTSQLEAYLRRQGVEPITEHAPSDTPGAARWADRRVTSSGRIHICNAKIYVGSQRAGHTLHVLFDATTIEIFDTDGVLIGHVPHPGKVPAGTFKTLTIRPWHPDASET